MKEAELIQCRTCRTVAMVDLQEFPFFYCDTCGGDKIDRIGKILTPSPEEPTSN